MIEVSVTRDIARPAADVFAFVADATNNPRWQDGMRSCVWTSEGSFPITFRRSVKAVDEATSKVTAVITGDASGFFKIAEPMMRPMVRRSIEGHYDRLKTLLEAEG